MFSPRKEKLVLLAYSVIHGIIFWLVQKGTLPVFSVKISLLALSALSYFWVRFDAKRKGYFPTKWIMVFVFILPIVGVPLYLQKYRDQESRRTSLRGFFGFVILMAVLFILGTFLADLI
jgi:hypothetical protein